MLLAEVRSELQRRLMGEVGKASREEKTALADMLRPRNELFASNVYLGIFSDEVNASNTIGSGEAMPNKVSFLVSSKVSSTTIGEFISRSRQAVFAFSFISLKSITLSSSDKLT